MSTFDAALDLIRRGFAITPITFRTKKPSLGDEWQKYEITESNLPQYFNGAQQNVGAKLGCGDASPTDLDLDCPEAIAAAPYLLPRTATFGHASKRCSHWIYKTNLATTQARAAIKLLNADKGGILEIRMGGGGKASMTVFPPSIHISGEPITWENGIDQILEIDGDELLKFALQLGAASQLAQVYPKAGGRHDGSLVLGGFLRRCGLEVPRIKLIVQSIAVASGQPADKRNDMIRTAKDGAECATLAGYPLMVETFGEAATKKVADWLDYQGERGAGNVVKFETPGMREREEDKPIIPARRSDAATFLRAYQPISYTLGGILPSGSAYGLTGKQGSGKTSFMIPASIAVAMGLPELLGLDEVCRGRVAYITIENPADFRMKLAVNCYVHGITYEQIGPELTILDGRETPEAMIASLIDDVEEFGPFQLICFDTFQAGFAAANGGDFNSNSDVLAFALRLRNLTNVPTTPSLLIAFHPIKNADESSLVPYGGGALMNEIDGNLTLWNEGAIKLYQNRVRGPEFEPKFFRIEKLSSPDIVDVQGRQILLPVMRPTTERDAEEREIIESQTDISLLRALVLNPKASFREMAFATALPKSNVGRKIKKLIGRKMLTFELGVYTVTEKWKKALESTS
jgi:AAA domain/Bifunctional DNA primase/polymerase, N-terminal